MQRRDFVSSLLATGALGGAAFASQEAPVTRAPVYELIFFKLRIGDQIRRVDQWAEKVMLSAAVRHKLGPVGCFSLQLGVDQPQFLLVMEHSSFEACQKNWETLLRDEEWRNGWSELEGGDTPAYESFERRLLKATDFSPRLSSAVGKSKQPRFFELRVYHSPTTRQQLSLLGRFRGPEIKIFHRLGIYPILYGTTLLGPNMPNLTYLTPFDSLGARQKAWDAFGKDPEWIKVRANSVAEAGEIVNWTERLIFQATAYSQIL